MKQKLKEYVRLDKNGNMIPGFSLQSYEKPYGDDWLELTESRKQNNQIAILDNRTTDTITIKGLSADVSLITNAKKAKEVPENSILTLSNTVGFAFHVQFFLNGSMVRDVASVANNATISTGTTVYDEIRFLEAI